MGVRIVHNDVEQKLTAFIERVEDQLYDALVTQLESVLEQAAITARAFTAQRGRPTSAGSGRVASGAMAEAIDWKMLEQSARQIAGEFGFVDDKADYYIYQTVTGFKHYLSSEFIEPTFAIRDAGEKARGEVKSAIKAAIRSVRV